METIVLVIPRCIDRYEMPLIYEIAADAKVKRILEVAVTEPEIASRVEESHTKSGCRCRQCSRRDGGNLIRSQALAMTIHHLHGQRLMLPSCIIISKNRVSIIVFEIFYVCISFPSSLEVVLDPVREIWNGSSVSGVDVLMTVSRIPASLSRSLVSSANLKEFFRFQGRLNATVVCPSCLEQSKASYARIRCTVHSRIRHDHQ
jgi:hypothetical protein